MLKKPSLDRKKICEKAIELIESDGLENLSMRKLAEKLNVKGASLYNHITNKSELYDLIQEFLYSQIKTLKTEIHWQEHLVQLAEVTRQGLLSFPNVVPLFATRPTITESSLRQIEETLKILVKAGFKHFEAFVIFRNINTFTLGHVLAEVGHPPGGSDNAGEPSIMKMNIDNYPILKKASVYKSIMDFDKGFRLGIENMIKGLEYTLEKRKNQ